MEMDILGRRMELPFIYQPVWTPDGEMSKGRNDCRSRLEIILEADRVFNNRKIHSSSILDVGSNLGWFLFEMEHQGIGTSWCGLEREPEIVEAASHIGRELSSRCEFTTGENDTPGFLATCKAETVLLLSVTHHLGIKACFKAIADNQFIKTVYVEQATHMEFPDWAKRLVPDTRAVPAFLWRRKLNELSDDKFNVRLVGAARTHLDTVRYFYQLKRKDKKLVAIPGVGPRMVCECWSVPYINGIDDVESGKSYMKSADGKKFYKIKGGKGFESEWVEGVLLVDAFRWGLLPFLDLGKIRSYLRGVYVDGGFDIRPHNLMVDEWSNLHRIDLEDVIQVEDGEEVKREFQFFFNLI